MKNGKSELEKLKDNIWKTRKARINTAERLNGYVKFIKFLNVYYSCSIIVINLIDISNSKYNFEILLLAMSIILTISIIFLDSQQYLERSEKIKNCYIDLQKIYYDINEKNLVEKREEYYEILRRNENHSEFDYYKVLIQTKETTMKETMKYYFHNVFILLFRVIIILLPIVLLGYMFIK